MRQQPVSPALEERCRVRLRNDVTALQAYIGERCGERVRCVVERFGPRIRAVEITFTGLRTPFRDAATGAVVVREATVVAVVRFDASPFPYPLGPPAVRLHYPGLPETLAPWVGGVHWDAGGPLPEIVRRFFAWMEARGAGLGGVDHVG